MDRRAFLAGAAASAAAVALLRSGVALAGVATLAAQPPAGFVPLSVPGRVVRVKKAGCLEANSIFPKPDDAKEMLRRALEELTGKADLVEAAKLFVHPEDKVCVKVNGIAQQNMATNKELVLPFLEAMIAAGVPGDEHHASSSSTRASSQATRINARRTFRPGVAIVWHANNDATMDWRDIPGTQRRAKFVRVAHRVDRPHQLRAHQGPLDLRLHRRAQEHDARLQRQPAGLPRAPRAAPRSRILSAQDVLRSRLRLCIIDGFKLMAHGGPLYKQPGVS